MQCVVLKGNCKGASYEVGDQPELVEKHFSIWNAVYVDGSWQIVHPHWACSCLSGRNTGQWTKLETRGQVSIERFEENPGSMVRYINEDYFLPDPDEFIYKCMAYQKEWQLVDEPWDLDKFCNVPEFTMGSSDSDYTLRGPKTAVVVSREGKCEIRFRECDNPRSKLTYELFFDERNSEGKLPLEGELPRYIFFETNGKDMRLLVRFHVIGIYKLVIKVGGKVLVTFRLEAKEKSLNANLLPAVPEIGYGFCQTSTKSGLSEPSHTSGVVVTEPMGVETFSFRNIINADISCKLSHYNTDSSALQRYIEQTERDNLITITVRMPSGDEYALQIYQNQCINILNYLLTSQKKDFDTGEEKSLERNLALTCATGNTAQIYRAILDFEKAGFEDAEGLLLKAKHNMKVKKDEEKKKEEIARLSTALLTAIKDTNDEEGLNEAISRAEAAGFPELEDLLAVARRRARVASK